MGWPFSPPVFRFSNVLSIEEQVLLFDERGDAAREYELSYGTQAL